MDCCDSPRGSAGEREDAGVHARRAAPTRTAAWAHRAYRLRAIFDRYHIVNEQELLAAGDQLAAYLAQPARRHAAPFRLVRRTTA